VRFIAQPVHPRTVDVLGDGDGEPGRAWLEEDMLRVMNARRM